MTNEHALGPYRRPARTTHASPRPSVRALARPLRRAAIYPVLLTAPCFALNAWGQFEGARLVPFWEHLENGVAIAVLATPLLLVWKMRHVWGQWTRKDAGLKFGYALLSYLGFGAFVAALAVGSCVSRPSWALLFSPNWLESARGPDVAHLPHQQ